MLRKIAKVIDCKYLNPSEIRTGVVLGSGSEKEEYIVTKVFYHNSNYCIFEVNNSGFIEYVTVNDTIFNTQAICIPLSRINFWVEDTADSNLRDFQEPLADTIAQCFDGKSGEALISIAQLEAFIKNEAFKYSKLIYISSFILLCLIVTIFASFFRYNEYLSTNSSASTKLLVYMCTMGALGGFFSVARNMENYNVEIKTYKTFGKTIWGPYWAGIITRLSVSIIGAVIVYLLSQSNFFNIGEANHYVLMTLATLAGFSENFVPGMLTKFETNVSAGEPIRVKSGETNPSLGQAALNSTPRTNTTAENSSGTAPASASVENDGSSG